MIAAWFVFPFAGGCLKYSSSRKADTEGMGFRIAAKNGVGPLKTFSVDVII